MKEDGFQALNEASFASLKSSYYIMSDEEVKHRMETRRSALEALGLYVNQTHGPCPTDDSSEASRDANFAMTVRSIRGAKWIGATDIVIHPLMPKSPEYENEPQKVFELNLNWVKRLLPYAKDMNVRLNIENMPYRGLEIAHMETLVKLVKEIDDPYFGLCLDTGHCTSVGDSLPDVTRMCGDKLYTTHVHDNNLTQDLHLIPFTGKVNWQEFREALFEIGYDGVISLECNMPRNIPQCMRRSIEQLAAYGALWISGQRD